MMARRWSSLSRRGVRSSSDDPFLLRTHSVHTLHPLKGGRILTCIGRPALAQPMDILTSRETRETINGGNSYCLCKNGTDSGES